MSGPGPSPRVREITAEYRRALDIAFGKEPIPEELQILKPWSETRVLLDEYLPRGFRSGVNENPHEPRSGEFADLYFRSGHTLEECAERLGKGDGSPRSLNRKLQSMIADALGIPDKDARTLLSQFRVEKTCEAWKPWHDDLVRWTEGGITPGPIRVNFHENLYHAATLFERLSFPWRGLARESTGDITLVPTREFDAWSSAESPFLLLVTEGEKILNAICLADSRGARFTPTVPNWRSYVGPSGHLSRLLIGDGPVCLLTAFEPRPISVLDGTDSVAFLVTEGLCDTRRVVYVPNEYEGTMVRPFVPLSLLSPGKPPGKLDLFAFHETKTGSPVSVPIATYAVRTSNSLISGIEIEHHLGHLASWQKRGARQLDMEHVKSWLQGESDLIPRLEPIEISEGGAYHVPGVPGVTRKFANFLKQKLPVPKSYEGRSVLPRLTELNGERLLELRAYPEEERLVKTFRYENGRLIVTSEFGV